MREQYPFELNCNHLYPPGKRIPPLYRVINPTDDNAVLLYRRHHLAFNCPLNEAGKRPIAQLVSEHRKRPVENSKDHHLASATEPGN